MHDITHMDGKTLLEFAKEELLKLMETIPMLKHLGCMLFQSGCQNAKCGWWGIGISHMSDTILMLQLKSYHVNLKATLRTSKS
jgi:hypothetical protein